MTKIVGSQGRILNTDYYEIAPVFHGDESEVVAMPVSNLAEGCVVFSGTEQECRAYLRKLAILDGAYEYKNGGFVRVWGDSDG